MDQQQAVEVFGPEFKYVQQVPREHVVHVPHPKLNITRLVFCRNYRPFEPSSCTMGSNCKFVHADIDPETLPSHPIHVNYVWRHESLCTYERLPPGAVLQIAVDDGVEDIVSDRVLLTRGSLRACDYGTDLHKAHVQCEQYVNERMCNRGSECDAVHVVVVDATVEGDFRRARAPQNTSVQRRKVKMTSALCTTEHDAHEKLQPPSVGPSRRRFMYNPYRLDSGFKSLVA